MKALNTETGNLGLKAQVWSFDRVVLEDLYLEDHTFIIVHVFYERIIG